MYTLFIYTLLSFVRTDTLSNVKGSTRSTMITTYENINNVNNKLRKSLHHTKKNVASLDTEINKLNENKWDNDINKSSVKSTNVINTNVKNTNMKDMSVKTKYLEISEHVPSIESKVVKKENKCLTNQKSKDNCLPVKRNKENKRPESKRSSGIPRLSRLGSKESVLSGSAESIEKYKIMHVKELIAKELKPMLSKQNKYDKKPVVKRNNAIVLKQITVDNKPVLENPKANNIGQEAYNPKPLSESNLVMANNRIINATKPAPKDTNAIFAKQKSIVKESKTTSLIMDDKIANDSKKPLVSDSNLNPKSIKLIDDTDFVSKDPSALIVNLQTRILNNLNLKDKSKLIADKNSNYDNEIESEDNSKIVVKQEHVNDKELLLESSMLFLEQKHIGDKKPLSESNATIEERKDINNINSLGRDERENISKQENADTRKTSMSNLSTFKTNDEDSIGIKDSELKEVSANIVKTQTIDYKDQLIDLNAIFEKQKVNSVIDSEIKHIDISDQIENYINSLKDIKAISNGADNNVQTITEIQEPISIGTGAEINNMFDEMIALLTATNQNLDIENQNIKTIKPVLKSIDSKELQGSPNTLPVPKPTQSTTITSKKDVKPSKIKTMTLRKRISTLIRKDTHTNEKSNLSKKLGIEENKDEHGNEQSKEIKAKSISFYTLQKNKVRQFYKDHLDISSSGSSNTVIRETWLTNREIERFVNHYEISLYMCRRATLVHSKISYSNKHTYLEMAKKYRFFKGNYVPTNNPSLKSLYKIVYGEEKQPISQWKFCDSRGELNVRMGLTKQYDKENAVLIPWVYYYDIKLMSFNMLACIFRSDGRLVGFVESSGCDTSKFYE